MPVVTQFELLLACFRSGQMTYPQLAEYMRDDAAFAEYVRVQTTMNKLVW